jgi:hypothetical protein
VRGERCERSLLSLSLFLWFFLPFGAKNDIFIKGERDGTGRGRRCVAFENDALRLFFRASSHRRDDDQERSSSSAAAAAKNNNNNSDGYGTRAIQRRGVHVFFFDEECDDDDDGESSQETRERRRREKKGRFYRDACDVHVLLGRKRGRADDEEPIFKEFRRRERW